MSSNILLMFLGGLPSPTSEMGIHWQNIIAAASPQTLTNFWVIVHPISLTNDTTLSNISFWTQTFRSRFMVVDSQHWVKTAWATRSLVDATLLMMQYARLSGTFKKYVLLSSSCCPILTLSGIQHLMSEDNRSWIQGKDQGYPREFQPVILESQGGLFNMNHLNFYSQWMALDQQHADLFFIGSRTYVVDPADVTCNMGTTNAVYINSDYQSQANYGELQSMLKSFGGGFVREEYVDASGNWFLKPCAPSDEHVFGVYLMKKVIGSSDANMIEKIKANFRYFPVQALLSILDQVETRYMTSLLAIHQNVKGLTYVEPGVTHQARFWAPSFGINRFGISNKKFYYCNESNSPPSNLTLNADGSVKGKVSTNCPKTCDNTQWHISASTCVFTSGKAKSVASELYLQSQTYTDWNAFSRDPENMLRDFRPRSAELGLTGSQETLWSQFNVLQFLQNYDTPKQARQALMMLDNDLLSKGLKPYAMQWVHWPHSKMPNYHPVEYSSWSLRSMCNACVLMSYLYRTFLKSSDMSPQSIFWNTYNQYMKLILGKFGLTRQQLLSGTLTFEADKLVYDIFPDVIDNMSMSTDKIFGTIITPHVLTAAWATQCPFIRKCKQGCGIANYTSSIIAYGDQIANVTAREPAKLQIAFITSLATSIALFIAFIAVFFSVRQFYVSLIVGTASLGTLMVAFTFLITNVNINLDRKKSLISFLITSAFIVALLAALIVWILTNRSSSNRAQVIPVMGALAIVVASFFAIFLLSNTWTKSMIETTLEESPINPMDTEDMIENFTYTVVIGQRSAGILSIGNPQDPGVMPLRSKVLSADEQARRAGDVDVSKCLGESTAYTAETMHDSVHIPGDASEEINRIIALQRD